MDIPGETVSQSPKTAMIASALMGTYNFLESEKKFGDFERILKGKRGEVEENEAGLVEPTPFEAKSLVTSLIMVRNQVAMFAGKKGREALETKIRGIAADLYLNLAQAIHPTEPNQKRNVIFNILLENAAHLLNWSEQTIHLEWPENKEIGQTLSEANHIVRSLSSRMMQGEQLNDDDREHLNQALVRIQQVETQLSKPTVFKLGELAHTLMSKVSDLLRDIVTESDKDPVDGITKQVNVLGDLLTITWDKDSTLKRILKAMLLGLVRTQIPKMKKFAFWLDKIARDAHEKLYAGEGFPEHMLYLLE